MPEIGEIKQSKTGKTGRWDGQGWEDITGQTSGAASAPTPDAATRLAALKVANAKPLAEASTYGQGAAQGAIEGIGQGAWDMGKGLVKSPIVMLQNILSQLHDKPPSWDEQVAGVEAGNRAAGTPTSGMTAPSFSEDMGSALGMMGMAAGIPKVAPAINATLRGTGRVMNTIGQASQAGDAHIVPQWPVPLLQTITDETIMKPGGKLASKVGMPMSRAGLTPEGPSTPFSPADHKLMGAVQRGIQPPPAPPTAQAPTIPAGVDSLLAKLRMEQMNAPVEPVARGMSSQPPAPKPIPPQAPPPDRVSLIQQMRNAQMTADEAVNAPRSQYDQLMADKGPMRVDQMGPGPTNKLMGGLDKSQRAAMHKTMGGMQAEMDKLGAGETSYFGQNPRWYPKQNDVNVPPTSKLPPQPGEELGQFTRRSSAQAQTPESTARYTSLAKAIMESPLPDRVKQAFISSIGGGLAALGLTDPNQQ